MRHVTDQYVTEAAECVHTQLTPLVYEKCILQPLTDHTVHLLQPDGGETERQDVTKKEIRAMPESSVPQSQQTLILQDFTTLENLFPTLQANAPAPTNLELFTGALHFRSVSD